MKKCQNCGNEKDLAFCPECLKEKKKEIFFCCRCRIGYLCIDHHVDNHKMDFIDDYFEEKYMA